MAGDANDATKVAEAKVQLRTLSQAETRRQLQGVGAQQQKVGRELRRVEQSLRRPELTAAERGSLKQRESILLGQQALCLKQQSTIRHQSAVDAQLTVLSPGERRALESCKGTDTWKVSLAPDRDAGEEASPVAGGYVTSLREALQRHQRGCELQLPSPPKTEESVTPRSCLRLAVQPPRKRTAERRRDPSDGRFKSKAEFLKGHCLEDWAKAETMNQRRENRKQESRRDWLRRKEFEKEALNRCIFSTEAKISRAADGVLPGVLDSGAVSAKHAELLRNAVASGSVATALRQSGIKGVRTLVAGLLAAEDEDDPKVSALIGASPPAPSAARPSASSSAPPPQNTKRRNPFGRPATEGGTRLPEQWPLVSAETETPARPPTSPYLRRNAPAVPSPRPRRGNAARVGLRFGLSADALGRLHSGWQPRPVTWGEAPACRQYESLQSEGPEGVPEPDPQYELR